MLKLSIKDFRAAITTILHEREINVLEMNGKTDLLSRQIEILKKNQKKEKKKKGEVLVKRHQVSLIQDK